jgi:hypothetical protein
MEVLVFVRHFFIAALVSFAALVSACQSPGNGYLMNGIGAELPARDIVSATKLQKMYFDHLCAQAGLGDGGCALGLNDRVGWTLVVQQGMNDIDRRCDAYLEWLDNQKRNRGPLLSQVTAVQNTTSAIIGFVAPGSTKALNVVLAAFGLLSKSIENYHSRLILDIESSTINSVVLRARNDFRQAASGLEFASKPDAEYALREYLRRCLPFAIESQINDLSTLGSRGIRADESNSIFQAPIGSRLLRDTPKSSRDPIVRTRISERRSGGGAGTQGRAGQGSEGGTTAEFDTLAVTDVERSLRRDEVESIQRKLCADVTGRFDGKTRIAVAKMHSGLDGPASDKLNSGTDIGILSEETENSCGAFLDAFEKFHFRASPGQSAEKKVKGFQTALNLCVRAVEGKSGTSFPGMPASGTLVSGALDGVSRDAIKYVLPLIKDVQVSSAATQRPLTPQDITAITDCTPL